MMVSKLDGQTEICALASLIVKMYGEDAPAQAAQHAKVMQGLGNSSGSTMWNRVSQSAKDLLAKHRGLGAPIH